MLTLITFLSLIFAVIVASELVIVFTPLIVYLATLLITWIAPKIQGLAILLVLVPILSFVTALVSSWVLPEGTGFGFWADFGLGLAAVFLNEVVTGVIGLTKT